MRLRQLLKWIVRLGAVFIVLLLAERAISVPPAFLWDDRAGADACPVYEAFFRSLPLRDAALLQSSTTPWKPWLHGKWARASSEHDNSDRVSLRFNSDNQFGLATPKEFDLDVSDFFAPLASKTPLFIRHCFGNAAVPRFYDGPWTWLRVRELAIGPDHGAEMAWWQLSPVGISPDRTRAILYATNVCEGWCGAGLFFLFERRAGRWELVGTSWVWVA